MTEHATSVIILGDGRYRTVCACSQRWPPRSDRRRAEYEAEQHRAYHAEVRVMTRETEMPESIVTCPACGAPMIERRNTQNGSTFLGCTRYPDCRQTQPLPACVEVQRAGGLPLPGFDEPGFEEGDDA